MRTLLASLSALALIGATPAPHDPAVDEAALAAALAKDNRADDRARDKYRNPAETLAFFQVAPGMKVGEYAPGGGWYSKVLANYLNDDGKLVGLFFDPSATPFDADRQASVRAGAAAFPGQLAEKTGMAADRFGAMTLDAIPEAEQGTYDRVIVVRMMHNILRWNMADSELKAMRSLLKDGGMLGIVQHRAKPGQSGAMTDGNRGYLRQSDVIGLVEAMGFELVGTSEVNANPNDPADWERGVWEMPPVWGTKNPKSKDLGESDRMTLLFRKR